MSNAGWQYVESLFSIFSNIFVEVEFDHYSINVTLFYIYVKQCDNGRHRG